MSLLQATILGIIQGLTEFIPISSSGHLVLVRELFGWKDTGFAFDAILHLGTLFAVIVYFWKIWKKMFIAFGFVVAGLFQPDLFKKAGKEDVKLLLYIIVATIPALIAGYFFMDIIENVFRNIIWVVVFLIMTGVLLIGIELLKIYFKRRSNKFGVTEKPDSDELLHLGVGKALLIGVMQAVALLPGVSRSGMAMAGGIFVGLTRQAAARFSFLISGPVVIAAGALGLIYIKENGTNGIGVWEILIGFTTSLVVGYFTVKYMLKYLNKNKFYVFSLYLIVLGIVLFLLEKV
ncbi:MAG: hypothetical protein ACD_63C00254G0008 [uncultured bacterium]|nr:MAG: hypothetical protein ACD_63C00254G0008 [uncultured bacterium]